MNFLPPASEEANVCSTSFKLEINFSGDAQSVQLHFFNGSENIKWKEIFAISKLPWESL